jgi:PAS domain S-box-containing protein
MSSQLATVVLALLCFSIILTTIFIIYLTRIRNKRELVKWCKVFSFSLFVWILGSLLMVFGYKINYTTESIFVNISFTGLHFFSVPFFFTGVVYANSHIKIKKRYFVLFIIPVISTIVTWTNDFHHLMYKKYDVMLSGIEVGPIFIYNAIFQYFFIASALVFFLGASIKNSGFFSKQSLLILLASILPLTTSFIYNFSLFDFPTNSTSISFSFSVLCLLVAVFKYEFLKVVPVAVQQIVNRISDSYIVVDHEQNIVDFNKTFEDSFKKHITIKRKINVCKIIDELLENSNRVHEYFRLEEDARKSYKFETYIEKLNKYYTVEVTPIILKMSTYVGTIILFKDITDHKNYIETINKSHSIMMEKERLASLGQFIGGIAHNLRTPIMSLSGSIQALDELIREYVDSIDDKNVTSEDHHEIAGDMKTWINKMQPTIVYISDIISAVKGQAVSPDYSTNNSFYVSDLTKRLEILVDHELRLSNCYLKINNNLDKDEELDGEISCLVQVFNNIIKNSADAYGKAGGKINLEIDKINDKIRFSIRDFAKGIPESVQKKLFKEMVTTKGMNGTGLGLYISQLNLKARFDGEISYKTKEKEGTVFYIEI